MQDLHEVQAAVQAFRREAANARVKPLHDFVRMGNASKVAEMLAQGVDCNAMEEVTGQGALHVAAQARQFELFELLLKAAADVALRSRGGDTPLLLACGFSGTEVNPARCKAVQAMLQEGTGEQAKVAACSGNDSGATPLLRIVMRLRQLASSPFASASALEEELALAQLLLEKGADPSAPDVFGTTPAGEAIKSQHPAVCQLFGT